MIQNNSSTNPGHSGTLGALLTDVQLRSIELTIQGFTVIRIAEMLNIDRKTLWRWKTQDADYRRALNDARVQIHGVATDRYYELLKTANDVLARFMEDGGDSKHRFRAAQSVLNMAAKFKPAEMLPEAPLPKQRRPQPVVDP